ncbi:MAG: hypothetical protein B7733_15850 [Myxococcales bacterium FL481]|nr:MAG: hypothetical protein B7733_15850 [Myxococcales bacterium FL481]
MLRLPPFQVSSPTTLRAVLEALAEGPNARLLAGGTDLLPNLKHRLAAPERLISLARVPELVRIEDQGSALSIGSGVTLRALGEHERVRRVFPSLATAAGEVASPVIRNMGTLGGNIHLEPRCRYVNQSAFWRRGIGGGCLKSEGDRCHVVPKGRNCVAAMSSDCVPVLIALEADFELASVRGSRVVAARDYFRADGLRATVRADDEVLVAVRLPTPTARRLERYVKWTVRKSIDFPLISIALRFDLEGPSDDASVLDAVVVVGVLGAKPRRVGRMDELVGRSAGDPQLAEEVADRVHAQCKPLENVPYEADYRRKMLR